MRGSGGTTRTSHTVRAMPRASSSVGGFFGRLDHLADREDAHVARRARTLRAVRPLPTSSAPTWRAAVFGHRNATGPDGGAHRVAEHHADLLVRRRREHGEARDLGEQREVVEAVVARAVVAGDAGAVDTEDDGHAVQPDVVDELVPRPTEERGVDRDDRAQAAHGHARGRGDRVLLGDPDVEAAVGEALGEREQPVEPGMPAVMATISGCRSARSISATRERVGERRRVPAARQAGVGVERADVVQPLLVVGLGRARSPSPCA